MLATGCFTLSLMLHIHIYRNSKEQSAHRRALYFWFKYDLGQKYYSSKVRTHDLQIISDDSTFHATEMPALTTRLSVTLYTQFRSSAFIA